MEKKKISYRLNSYCIKTHVSLPPPQPQNWAEGAPARRHAKIRRGPERSSRQLTKTRAGLSEESPAGCQRPGRQRRRGPPPARTAVERRRQGRSRRVLCAEVNTTQVTRSFSGREMRDAALLTHCSEDQGEPGGAGDDERQQAQAVAQNLCLVLSKKAQLFLQCKHFILLKRP